MEDHKKEKKGHLLDLKLPIGWLFAGYGLLLSIYGLVTRKDAYARSLGININLFWGIFLIFFGSFFLLLACLKKRSNQGE